MLRCLRCMLMFTICVGVLGCGQGGFRIHGKITVDGVPLEQGELKFVPMDSSGGDHVGTVVEKGEYSVDDIERLKGGEYQVQIRAFRTTGKKIWDGMGDGTKKNMGEDMKQFIPIKYNDASELKVTLQPGDNQFNTDLKIAK